MSTCLACGGPYPNAECGHLKNARDLGQAAPCAPVGRLYLECHITVEPLFGTKLTRFGELCAAAKFKPADLLMQKRETDTPERSRHDTFATGRGEDEMELRGRMIMLIAALQAGGFKVWRYKIEDTLLDSRVQGDVLLLGIGD